jgi:hypothetical protein
LKLICTAEFVNLIRDEKFRPIADSHHAEHTGNPDGNAENRQRGTQPILSEVHKPRNDGIMVFHFVGFELKKYVSSKSEDFCAECL